jgi:hypothetical protein
MDVVPGDRYFHSMLLGGDSIIEGLNLKGHQL